MVGHGSASSIHFSLQQSRSTEVAVNGPVAAQAHRSVSHPAECGIAVTSAPLQNELPSAGNTDDGGRGRAAGEDWANFRARQLHTASESPWATGAGSALTAPTEHEAWFDARVGDGGSGSVRACTDSFDQAPDGPSGADETRLIVNPIRPATPPRMQRIDPGRVESSSVGGSGSGPSAIDCIHSGFNRGGEVLERQSDREWDGSDVGQAGGRVLECSTGTGNAKGAESAQVGKTIAKKLDFHDVFLDPV